MLIVFEGIDGSGKGSQIRRLIAYFRQHGIGYKLHKFPTKRAADALLHLEGKKDVAPLELAGIFADDILAEKEKMKQELSQGLAVICDRYLHSTLAYQGANLGYAKVKALVEAKDALVPDAVVLLDIDARIGAERKKGQKKPDRFERDVAFLAEVRKNYLQMEKEHFLSYKYVVVDATRAQDGMFTEIVTQIEPMLTGKKGK